LTCIVGPHWASEAIVRPILADASPVDKAFTRCTLSSRHYMP
jgi:hypothetical protein